MNEVDDGKTAIIGIISSHTLVNGLTTLGLFTLKMFYMLVQPI